MGFSSFSLAFNLLCVPLFTYTERIPSFFKFSLSWYECSILFMNLCDPSEIPPDLFNPSFKPACSGQCPNSGPVFGKANLIIVPCSISAHLLGLKCSLPCNHFCWISPQAKESPQFLIPRLFYLLSPVLVHCLFQQVGLGCQNICTSFSFRFYWLLPALPFDIQVVSLSAAGFSKSLQSLCSHSCRKKT